MPFSHPYQRIPSDRRLAVFLGMLAFTLLLTIILQVVDGPLKTGPAPVGIVSYEFAWDTATAQRILDSWKNDAPRYAGFSLGLDYLYMPVYAITIGLPCAWAAGFLGRRRPRLARLGAALAWGLWLAALFDSVENIALTIMLFRGVALPWPPVAAVSASLKFALIAAGWLYAGIAWLWRRQLAS